MTFTRKIATAVAGVAAATLALTGCEQGIVQGADNYYFTVANGAMDGTHNAAIMNAYFDEVEERADGRIEFDRSSFEAVCTMSDVADCVRDGRADIGLTVTDYTPHLLPTQSVMSITFLNTDIQAAVEALYEVHQTYEPAKQRMESANLEYIANWPVGALLVGSKQPVETMEDLKGLRMRAAGPVTQRSLQAAGINVNAFTASETYENIQRGALDSVAGSLDFGVNYAITELLPHWTDPGLGQYTSYGMWWNKHSYDSLTPELQEIVDDVTREFAEGRTVEELNKQLDDICRRMLESPDVESFTSWPESETQRWIDLAADQAEGTWLEIMSDYHFDEAPEYLEEYKRIYESHTDPNNPLDAGVDCVNRWQDAHN